MLNFDYVHMIVECDIEIYSIHGGIICASNYSFIPVFLFFQFSSPESCRTYIVHCRSFFEDVLKTISSLSSPLPVGENWVCFPFIVGQNQLCCQTVVFVLLCSVFLANVLSAWEIREGV